MYRKTASILACAALLSLLACGSADRAKELCQQNFDLIIGLTQKCNLPQQAPDQGKCDRVKEIRDEASFVNECIPFLQSTTCERLLQGLPPSCLNQLNE